MEPDETVASGTDPLSRAVRQDLDPLSIAELEARIATLEAEIVRSRAKIAAMQSHRASADAVFKR